MPTINLNEFCNIVDDVFPKSILISKGARLYRNILVIDTKDDQSSDETTHESNYSLLSYSKDADAGKNILLKLIKILDDNLGPIYVKKSYAIYGNKKPWKENKITEMQSEGLIYVTYCDEYNEPILFMSFMLTDDDDFKGDGSNVSVIYLYEIQLTGKVRNKKLGTLLMDDYLKKCGEKVKMTLGDQFVGVELTVFSNNLAALRFYEKLGYLLTPTSPRDKIMKLEKKITRSRSSTQNNQFIKQLLEQKIVKKPDYYLLYLPISLEAYP